MLLCGMLKTIGHVSEAQYDGLFISRCSGPQVERTLLGNSSPSASNTHRSPSPMNGCAHYKNKMRCGKGEVNDS